jgi:hypothetical protein
MRALGTIREFKTKNFTVIVDAIEDDCGIDDLHSEPEAQQEIIDNLNSGKWIQFTARARVLYHGNTIASDYLGGCVYTSLEEFADHIESAKYKRETGRNTGSYFADMIATVCAEARKAILETQTIYIRG